MVMSSKTKETEMTKHKVALGESYGPSRWSEIMVHPTLDKEKAEKIADDLGTYTLSYEGSEGRTVIGANIYNEEKTKRLREDEQVHKVKEALEAEGHEAEAITESTVKLGPIERGETTIEEAMEAAKRGEGSALGDPHL